MAQSNTKLYRFCFKQRFVAHLSRDPKIPENVIFFRYLILPN